MTEDYTKLKVVVYRTLTPKPYNSIKIGLEYEENGEGVISLNGNTLENRYATVYNKLKKTLNEIEGYEVNRIK